MTAPSPKQFLACAGLVASTYAYFLLFAQFAFLDLASVRLGQGRSLQGVIFLQGLGGIAGSFLAAWIFRPARAGPLVAIGLLLAATAAAIAPSANTVPWLATISGLTGLAVGVTTVALAARLRGWVGAGQLGWCVGLGTGLAYGLCSMPVLFDAPAEHQSLAAAAVALVGALVVTFVRSGADDSAPPTPPKTAALPWFAAFAALVALDSAVFYIIQNTSTLKQAVWSGEARQWGVAFVHLVAAAVAGHLLGRGSARLVPSLSLIGLAIACLLLARPWGWLSLLYAGAVSFYSTALVHYAARSASARHAAAFYVICGWLASGVGLGLAQGREEVSAALWMPLGFVAGAALLRARLSRIA